MSDNYRTVHRDPERLEMIEKINRALERSGLSCLAHDAGSSHPSGKRQYYIHWDIRDYETAQWLIRRLGV